MYLLPAKMQRDNFIIVQDRHQSSGHIHGDKSTKDTLIRNSSRKSNLKPPRTS